MRGLGLVMAGIALAAVGATAAALLSRDPVAEAARTRPSAPSAVTPSTVIPAAALAAVPDVPAIQVAYTDAKADAANRHFDDLTIHSADCGAIDPARFYCQISYLRSGDEGAGHLYFTVVTMERGSDRWVLKSGLCRGDDAGH
jgi:hypothetical protein